METVHVLRLCPDTCPRLGDQRQALSKVFFLIFTLVRVYKPGLIPFSLLVGQSRLLNQLCPCILADTQLFVLMLVIALGSRIRLDGILDVTYGAVHDVADIRSGGTGSRCCRLEDATLRIGRALWRLVGDGYFRDGEVVVVGRPSAGSGIVGLRARRSGRGSGDGGRRCLGVDGRLLAVDGIFREDGRGAGGRGGSGRLWRGRRSGLGRSGRRLGDVCCREEAFFALWIPSLEEDGERDGQDGRDGAGTHSPPAVAKGLVFLKDDDVVAGLEVELVAMLCDKGVYGADCERHVGGEKWRVERDAWNTD